MSRVDDSEELLDALRRLRDEMIEPFEPFLTAYPVAIMIICAIAFALTVALWMLGVL